jgi:hypothetical protein
LEAACGMSPSVAMEKKMRDCAISWTIITEINPTIAAILINGESQKSRIASMATATGAATFRLE